MGKNRQAAKALKEELVTAEADVQEVEQEELQEVAQCQRQ